MIYYLLTSRSLTYAQAAKNMLMRRGVSAFVTRTPQLLEERGCGYAVKVRAGDLTRALDALRSTAYAPVRVFRLRPDGAPEEVEP